MRLLRYFSVAGESIIAHKLRAILTMLGIIIGVAAVLTTMGIGSGAAKNITGQIESQGTNLLTINAGGSRGGSSASKLTMGDVEVLSDRSLFPDLAAVIPEYSGSATLVNGDANRQSQVVGTVATYATVRNLIIASGRFFSDGEVTGTKRVVVLGSTAASDLFGTTDPLGQTIRMDNDLFQVIGVLKKTGGSGFGSNDDRAFVPISVAQFASLQRPTLSRQLYHHSHQRPGSR